MVYKRKRRTKKKTSVSTLVNRALARKVEVKDCTQVSSGPVSNAGVLIPLFTAGVLAQGAASDQRIGNEINLLSTKISCLSSQTDSPYNRIRYALIKCRSRVTTVASVFNPTSFTAFGAIFANWNYDVVEKVYLERTLMLRATASSGAAVSPIMMTAFRKHYIKMKQKLHFQSNLSGPQEQLYLFVCSDSSIVPHPNFNMLLNHRYTDQ